MPSHRFHELGDLYVHFTVEFPDKLDEKSFKLLEEALPARPPQSFEHEHVEETVCTWTIKNFFIFDDLIFLLQWRMWTNRSRREPWTWMMTRKKAPNSLESHAHSHRRLDKAVQSSFVPRPSLPPGLNAAVDICSPLIAPSL